MIQRGGNPFDEFVVAAGQRLKRQVLQAAFRRT